jgi:hypothetical protein
LFLSVLSLETTESNALKNLAYLEAPVTVRPRSDDLSLFLLHLVLYLLVLEEFFLVAPFLIPEEGDCLLWLGELQRVRFENQLITRRGRRWRLRHPLLEALAARGRDPVDLLVHHVDHVVRGNHSGWPCPPFGRWWRAGCKLEGGSDMMLKAVRFSATLGEKLKVELLLD